MNKFHTKQKTGQRKLDDLRNNSNYFRKGLINMGLQVLGDADSPVMPVLLYNPTKIGAFSRECLKRGLAVRIFFVSFVQILSFLFCTLFNT